eukprot:30102-Pelagococcus_subviridis.AAC.15
MSPSPQASPAASCSTAMISAPTFCSRSFAAPSPSPSPPHASASSTIRGNKNSIVRVSCLNTPALHAANNGASGPVASTASARHHAYIHRRNVGPPGAAYSGRFVCGFAGFCVRQYIDVSPGASNTLTSSGSARQNASPSTVAPSGRRCSPPPPWPCDDGSESDRSADATTSSARTIAGRHPTCTRISCTASALASSMSTSFAPLTVRAMWSHSSAAASACVVPVVSDSADAVGMSIRPGSTAPSSPKHCAARRCARRDKMVRFSPAQHRSNAATRRPTTAGAATPSSPAPARSADTADGSARSARRSSPSAVARTACDSSSAPSVNVASNDGSGTSPRSLLTAAFARARRSHAGSMGNRARCPRMHLAPARKTSSSITSAAACALSTPVAVAPSSPPPRLPRLPALAPPDADAVAVAVAPPPPLAPSGRCGSIATTTRPATRRRWSGACIASCFTTSDHAASASCRKSVLGRSSALARCAMTFGANCGKCGPMR